MRVVTNIRFGLSSFASLFSRLILFLVWVKDSHSSIIHEYNEYLMEARRRFLFIKYSRTIDKLIRRRQSGSLINLSGL